MFSHKRKLSPDDWQADAKRVKIQASPSPDDMDYMETLPLPTLPHLLPPTPPAMVDVPLVHEDVALAMHADPSAASLQRCFISTRPISHPYADINQLLHQIHVERADARHDDTRADYGHVNSILRHAFLTRHPPEQ